MQKITYDEIIKMGFCILSGFLAKYSCNKSSLPHLD